MCGVPSPEISTHDINKRRRRRVDVRDGEWKKNAHNIEEPVKPDVLVTL